MKELFAFDWMMLRMALRRTFIPEEVPHLLSIPIEYKQAIKGQRKEHPSKAQKIWDEIFFAEAWIEEGDHLDEGYCSDLEERAKSMELLWPIASRIYVQQSASRETQARLMLSIQQLPFSLPNSLNATQVEVLASGEKVLNALHVDWTRKLANHTLDVLTLDCRSLGMWFDPILDVLPEKELQRALKKVPRARKLQAGSLGLAAYYAWRLNMNTDYFLRNATPKDKIFFELACFSSK